MASTHQISRRTAVPTAGAQARFFAIAWIGCMALAAVIQVVVDRPEFSQEIALLALLGFFGCARPIRLGSKLEICVAQPATFAAMLLSGTSAAMVVVVAAVLGASCLGRQRPGTLKIAFNAATGVATALAAGLVMQITMGSVRNAVTQELFLPLLGATFIAFLVSTVPVAAVVALEIGENARKLWITKFLPVAPTYLAGSGLAILLIMAVGALGTFSFLFFVPLALTVFNQSISTVTAR